MDMREIDPFASGFVHHKGTIAMKWRYYIFFLCTMFFCFSSGEIQQRQVDLNIPMRLGLPSATEKDFAEIEETSSKTQQIIAAGLSAIKLLYGSGLIIYGQRTPVQILILTVMRGLGISRVRGAMKELQSDIRRARFLALRNTPSIVMARRAIDDMRQRRDSSVEILQEIKKAKADGVITKKEYEKISRLRRKHLLIINRDIRRLSKGSSTMKRVFDELDLHKFGYVIQNLAFILLAVLTSGHSNSLISFVVTKYCQFCCQASLVLDLIIQKVDFPTSRLILRKLPFFPDDNSDIADEAKALVKVIGTFLVYIITFHLMLWHSNLARRLNTGLVASWIVINTIAAYYVPEMRNSSGAIMTIVLVFISLCCGSLIESGRLYTDTFRLFNSNLPNPLFVIEENVDKLMLFVGTTFCSLTCVASEVSYFGLRLKQCLA